MPKKKTITSFRQIKSLKIIALDRLLFIVNVFLSNVNYNNVYYKNTLGFLRLFKSFRKKKKEFRLKNTNRKV